MKKIVCVVGRTAAGKDTLVHDAYNPDFQEIIKSYTTRPCRGEDDKDAHIFITNEEYSREYQHQTQIAYTEINGYHYFTTEEQINDLLNKHDTLIYIIDPYGLEVLRTSIDEKKVQIVVVYVYACKATRHSRYIARGGDNYEFVSRNVSENPQFERFEQNIDYDFMINTDTMSRWACKEVLSSIYKLALFP